MGSEWEANGRWWVGQDTHSSGWPASQKRTTGNTRTCSCDKFTFSGWQAAARTIGPALIDTRSRWDVKPGEMAAVKRSGTPVSKRKCQQKSHQKNASHQSKSRGGAEIREGHSWMRPHFVPFRQTQLWNCSDYSEARTKDTGLENRESGLEVWVSGLENRHSTACWQW